MMCSKCNAYWEHKQPLCNFADERGCICDGYEEKKYQGFCERTQEEIDKWLEKYKQDEKIADLLDLLNENSNCMDYGVYSELFDAIEELSDMESYWRAAGYAITKTDHDTWAESE